MKLRPLMLPVCLTLALVPVIYLGSAALVFDFTRASLPDDEDIFGDMEVAIGPRPRGVFCRPTRNDVRWEGREWPFVVFAPVCEWWRTLHGYAPSAEWR